MKNDEKTGRQTRKRLGGGLRGDRMAAGATDEIKS